MLEPETVVILEEPRRGLVILGAGHDVERQVMAVSASQRDDLLGVDLEEAGARDRADGERALGSVESEPGARPARDQDDRDLAPPKRLLAELGHQPTRRAFAV